MPRPLAAFALVSLLTACSEETLPGASGGSSSTPAEQQDGEGAGGEGGQAGAGGDAPDEARPAVIALTLTDAPGDFEAVPVTIGAVYAHATAMPSDAQAGDTGGMDTGAVDTGAPMEDEDGGDEGGEWIALTEEPTEWDLLALQDGVTGLLGRSDVPPTAYDQIRFVVTEAAVVVDGETHPLTIPSGEQTGIKLSYDFDLSAGGTHELRLDFDAHESIRENPQGYRMQPVVTVDYFGPVESESAEGDVGEMDGEAGGEEGDTGDAGDTGE